jgi:ketosteroid isomerase-like protein
MSENQQASALVGADRAPLNQSVVRSFCADWHAACQAQDYERAVALCDDDGAWRDPITTEPQVGWAALGKVMAS